MWLRDIFFGCIYLILVQFATFGDSGDVIWRSCDEAKASGIERSSLQSVNVRGVTVACDTNTQPSLESITPSVPSKTCDSTNPCGTITFTYGTEYPAIEAWIKQDNRKCWQEMRYSCLGAPTKDESGAIKVSWKGGSGVDPGYWTGNKTYRCQCGMHDTCIYAGVTCNCDKGNTATWTSDDGKLEEKNLLPVKEVTIDTGTGRAEFNLERLYCQPEPSCFRMHSGGPLRSESAQGITLDPVILLLNYIIRGSGVLQDILYVGSSTGGEVTVLIMRLQSGMTYEVIHAETFTATGGPAISSHAVSTSDILNPDDVIAVYGATNAFATFSASTNTISHQHLSNYAQGSTSGTAPTKGSTVDFTTKQDKFAVAVRVRLKVDATSSVQWTYNQTCTGFSKDSQTSFDNITKLCNSMKGSVLSVGSPEKQDYVAEFLKSHSISSNVSIGLHWNGELRKWWDGSPLVYTNFASAYGIRKALACNGTSVKLTCSRKRIIRILYGHYGRTSHLVCPNNKTLLELNKCWNPTSFKAIVDECQNKTECSLSAPGTYGEPCSNANNYAEIHYDCIPDDKMAKCTVLDPTDNKWREVNCTEMNVQGLCHKVPEYSSVLDCITVTSKTGAARCPKAYPGVFGCICPCSSYVIFPDPGVCVCHCINKVTSSAARCCRANVPPHAGMDVKVEVHCTEIVRSQASSEAKCTGEAHPTAVSCTHSGTSTPVITDTRCIGANVTSVICCRQKSVSSLSASGFENVSNAELDSTKLEEVAATSVAACAKLCVDDVTCKSFTFVQSKCKKSTHPPMATAASGSNVYEKTASLLDYFAAPKYSVTVVSRAYERYVSTIVLKAVNKDTCVTSCMELKECSASVMENNTCHVTYNSNGSNCRMMTRQVQEKSHVAMTEPAEQTYAHHAVCKTITGSGECPVGTSRTSCSCMNGTTSQPGANVKTACACDGGTVSSQCCQFTGMYHNAPVACAPGQMRLNHRCEDCPKNVTSTNVHSHECIECPKDQALNSPPGHASFCDHCDFHWAPASNGSGCTFCGDGNRTRYLGQITCEVIDCGSPPTFNFSTPVFTNTTLNSSVSYDCKPGYNHSITHPPVNATCNFSYSMTTEKEEWSNITINCTEIDECESSPCQHSGTCQDEINKFTCNCSTGYTGSMCETDIDECESTPCQNEANCTDLIAGYNCACKPGFTGIHCETNIDECESTPCQNSATCNDQVNGYNCSCAKGFTGIHCETDIDECASTPCNNGGTCVDKVDGYNCTCVPGYTGIHCETDFDECSSSPCQHSGTCTDGVALYSCTCPVTYTGSSCETEVDECASVPCQNGAKCNDYLGFYNCTCQPGFNGTLCDQNIDECVSSPCVRGNCTDQVNGYKCVCPAGYSGANCETEIDECSSYPCQNNGICKDALAKFECTCTASYKGETCSKPVGCGPHWPLPGTDQKATGDKPGDTVTYTCKSGTRTIPGSGKGFIKCTLDGRWEGEGISCILVNAGPHPIVEIKNRSPYECQKSPEMTNAIRYGDGVYAGTMITYVCKTGYLLPSGSNAFTRICDNLGQWSIPMMQCGHVKCPAIPVTHGTVKSTSIRTLGSVVEFYCLPGFEFHDGTNIRTSRCLESGLWTVDVPMCKRIVCPAAISTNGQVVTRVPERVVDVKCPANHVLPNGRQIQTHVCLRKMWYQPITDCAPRCIAPPFVANTTAQILSTDVTREVKVTCIPGHRFPDGHRVKFFKCENGFVWTPPSLSPCKEIFCAPVPVVQGANRSQEVALIDTNVTYTCPKGQWFVALRSNTAVATCLSNATWVKVPDKCQDIRCGPIPRIANTNNDFKSDVFNSTVEYLCNGTWRFPFGETIRSTTCLINGQWSFIKDTCEDNRCSPVPVPKNTFSNTRLAEPDTIALIRCIKGYEFPNKTREVTSKCVAQNWTVSPPACQKVQCAKINRTSSRMVIKYAGGKVDHGYASSVEIKCLLGFMLSNTKLNITTECLDSGEWSIPPQNLTCEVLRCPAVRPVPYCNYASTKNTYGSLVKYSCKDGFSFADHTGVKVVECQGDTTWTIDIIGCQVIKCQALPSWDTYDYNSTDNTIFNPVRYTCSKGYNFTDGASSHVTRCLYNRFWYPPFKPCKSNGDNTKLGEPKESDGSAGVGAIAIGIISVTILGIFLLDIATIGREGLLFKQNLNWIFKK